ncbi:MAG: tRNA-splicing endonuclease subunit [Trizodia sp. TS-e1964]|nr:MAG: tRNA-splicing endonuclease subunit [Trizodia sp. TS-e1964]
MASPKSDLIRISLIGNRYLMFDINQITYLRREHHMGGVLFGSIPDIPQQNVFLGVPLELMPEEARLLVEQGHAIIIDDFKAHREGFGALSAEETQSYKTGLIVEGSKLARILELKQLQKKQLALSRYGRIDNGAPAAKGDEHLNIPADKEHIAEENSTEEIEEQQPELLSVSPIKTPSPLPIPTPSSSTQTSIDHHFITPTTTHSSLLPSNTFIAPLPCVPTSYPLFKYLHSQGYFLSPGLRFGCQYTAYPGDPLRYHSHFLAVGLEWEEEISLLDIVGGGRLGTGVKKGFLLGGEEDGKGEDGKVRAFCIEWGGM